MRYRVRITNELGRDMIACDTDSLETALDSTHCALDNTESGVTLTDTWSNQMIISRGFNHNSLNAG